MMDIRETKIAEKMAGQYQHPNSGELYLESSWQRLYYGLELN